MRNKYNDKSIFKMKNIFKYLAALLLLFLALPVSAQWAEVFDAKDFYERTLKKNGRYYSELEHKNSSNSYVKITSDGLECNKDRSDHWVLRPGCYLKVTAKKGYTIKQIRFNSGDGGKLSGTISKYESKVGDVILHNSEVHEKIKDFTYDIATNEPSISSNYAAATEVTIWADPRDEFRGYYIQVALMRDPKLTIGDGSGKLYIPVNYTCKIPETHESSAGLRWMNDSRINPMDNTITVHEAGTSTITAWTTPYDSYGAGYATAEVVARCNYANDAMEIDDEGDWDHFTKCVNVTGLTSLNATLGKTVGTVTTMVGTDQKQYSGTFDGKGNTLDVNLSGNRAAPFQYVQGATIKNMKVTGTVDGGSGDQYHSGGLVAMANGITIDHVNVGVKMKFGGGDAHNGGFVGHGLSGVVRISNSIFTGSTVGTTNFSPFMGWADDNTAYIDNCLEQGSSYEGLTGKLNPFVRAYKVGTYNVTNSYYGYNNINSVTDKNGKSADGTLATASARHDGSITWALQGSQNEQQWGQDLSQTGSEPLLIDNSNANSAKRVWQVTYKQRSDGTVMATQYCSPAGVGTLPEAVKGYVLLCNDEDFTDTTSVNGNVTVIVCTAVKPSLDKTEVTVDYSKAKEFVAPNLNKDNHPGSVTYSASNDVVTINATTGQVRFNKTGDVFITASFAKAGRYEAATCSYTLHITGSMPTYGGNEGNCPYFFEYRKAKKPTPNGHDGAVTYSVSDTTIMTINAKTGATKVKKIGNVNITATFAETEHYGTASCSYPVRIYGDMPHFANAEESVDYIKAAAYKITTPNNGCDEHGNWGHNGAVTYSVDKTDVATIDAKTGALKFVQPGDVVITATFAETEYYGATSCSYTLHITGTKPHFAKAEDNVYIADAKDYNLGLEKCGHDGTVTYSIPEDQTDIAIIDATTGALVAKQIGKVTVTAQFAESEHYGPYTVTTTLTFTGKGVTINGTDIVLASGDGWTYDGKELKISGSGPYTLSGKADDGSVGVAVNAPIGDYCNITLENLTLSGAYFNFQENSRVVLTLKGDNSLSGALAQPGLGVFKGAQVQISGDGNLMAEGGEYATGIGGTWSEGDGEIAIHAGNIKAYGGSWSAGIGASGHVMIEDGNVEAHGGSGSAGIGHNYQDNSQDLPKVEISGGNVIAYAGSIIEGTDARAAAIGGSSDSRGGHIEISGGNVKANTGIGLGSGEGVKDYDKGEDIVIITGGNVDAFSDMSEPTNGEDNGNEKVYRVSITDLPADASIDDYIALPAYYNKIGIQSDDTGRICLWLPTGDYHVGIEDKVYDIHVTSEKKTVQVADACIIGVGPSGYATYCGPNSLDFTKQDAISAYAVIGYVDDRVYITKKDKVSAKEPLLIIGKQGRYIFDEANVHSHAANLLAGTLEDTTVKGTEDDEDDGTRYNYHNYYLSRVNGVTGFYLAPDEGIAMPANRAWLHIRGEEIYGAKPAVGRYLLEEVSDPTAIERILNGNTPHSDAHSAVYNMQGQKVCEYGEFESVKNQLPAGIYVVKDKKVMIK